MTKQVATTDWKKALGKQVAAVQSSVDHEGMPSFSLKNGRMSFNDQLVPGDNLDVIIVTHVFERTWYDREYSADDKAAPDCFALGEEQYDLVPHENVPSPPSDSCKGCPMAEFGSARQGKGPACKTRARLCVMPAPAKLTPEMITASDTQLAIYKTQPTSVKGFSGKGGYLKKLASKDKVIWGVVTNIAVVPHDKFLHETQFEAQRDLGSDEMMGAVYSRIPEATEALLTPYAYEEDDVKPKSETKTAGKTKY